MRTRATSPTAELGSFGARLAAVLPIWACLGSDGNPSGSTQAQDQQICEEQLCGVSHVFSLLVCERGSERWTVFRDDLGDTHHRRGLMVANEAT